MTILHQRCLSWARHKPAETPLALASVMHAMNIMQSIPVKVTISFIMLCHNTGLVLGLGPANEIQRYFVTPSLIGWAQTWNQPCDTIRDQQWHGTEDTKSMG